MHIDVALKLWSRNEHRTTVREVRATAAGQQLQTEHFTEMTLDAGAKPEELWPRFEAPDDEELAAKAGDIVTVELLLTRGRTRKLKPPIHQITD
jgi:hypothetical protein